MSDLATIALIVLGAILVVVFLKVHRSDALGAIAKKRQPTSKLVSRADYMEGMEKIAVVMSLSADTFYYENPDLDASFELGRIDEVEYDDELSTGRTVDDKCRVLRIRSHSAAFEFVLEKNEAKKWADALPPRAINESPAAHAV